MHKVCVLTGAGMSAESGIKTFRDNDGLWEGHNVHEVASPEGWSQNRGLVLDFYNKRRAQLKEVEPNEGHLSLIKLEDVMDTVIITQNVDNLHERAGSRRIIHLHGELTKVRSLSDPSLIYDWKEDLNEGDLCELGSQLRPHIVWFGEAVPKLEEAITHMMEADHILIIGTSMQVYPAAGLTAYAPDHTSIYYVDPNPQINYELNQKKENLHILQGPASTKVKEAVELILAASS